MEIIFEIIAELFLQVGVELLVDVIARALKQPFSKRYVTHPVLVVIVYALVGAAFGGISLLALPRPFLRDDALRIAYLVLSPVVAGLLMQWIGAALQRRDRGRTRLETFAAGFAFAFAFAVVRFLAT